MKYIRLYEEFQMGDLNFMPPEEIQDLFMQECKKQTPDINLIRVIVENGLVDVNAKYNYERSPLHYAVDRNNIALAEYLISVGADVNAKDGWGKSPLHWAVQEDDITMVKLLISAGADVNAKNDYGRSPLDYAISRGNEETQALLKQHGAL